METLKHKHKLTSGKEKGETDVEYTFHLFVRPKDEKAEIWDGARSGVQAAQDVFNADEAQSIDALPSSRSSSRAAAARSKACRALSRTPRASTSCAPS
jgi:hypothetical protein